ncbi:MAG TPA: DUF1348 family protein [Candidatus Binataceae bacterium]|nr:DUF1348 family protein [Candidatus Binataceae bacterium]
MAQAYTEDSEWRSQTGLLKGRETIKAFLKRKREKELDCRQLEELRCFSGDRISVSFESGWHDANRQW